MNPLTKLLIELFEARLAWEKLPTEVRKTRNGWAAYKGDRRITKFFFSEQGATSAGLDWESAGVKTTVVDDPLPGGKR